MGTVGNTFLETLDNLLLFQHLHVFTPTYSINLRFGLRDDEHSVTKFAFTDSLRKSA